ncbi:MAG: N-acetyl-gamma-glutamyl-phosphate reductase [Clostridia bacterium]|nr:N-acetyl-gamma-glutamyl-phosphate reductase [Clostridia bacterium]
MINIGILGATGYAANQLVSILLKHKNVKISKLYSLTAEKKDVSFKYPSFYKILDMKYSGVENYPDDCDLIFACLPSGESELYAEKAIAKGLKFIDVGSDFRLKDEQINLKWYKKSFRNKDLHKQAVYGISELNAEQIKSANLIANPGCYPTSAILALAPILSENLTINTPIIIDSKSGLTGSGKRPTESSHFVNANENFTPYSIGSHRHLPEIEQALSEIAGEYIQAVFTPHLLPINRGILSSIYVNCDKEFELSKIHKIYEEFYKDKKFVRLLPLGQTVDIRQVQNSNFVNLSLHKSENTLIIMSAIDNMIKGAAGQAIQNMNLMFGFDEEEGLDLFPNSF